VARSTSSGRGICLWSTRARHRFSVHATWPKCPCLLQSHR
jgi:hypothetical protein